MYIGNGQQVSKFHAQKPLACTHTQTNYTPTHTLTVGRSSSKVTKTSWSLWTEIKKHLGKVAEDYKIQTRVSDCEKTGRMRKLVTNCKCALAALTDRPIILLAHLEAMPG